jgi:hypothetical protein
MFLLRKVPHHVRPALVALAQDVEEEEVDVVVERLVVQEHLGEVAQVLAIRFRFLAVDLEHRHPAAPVDLVAGGVLQASFLEVLEHLVAALEKLSSGEREGKCQRRRVRPSPTPHYPTLDLCSPPGRIPQSTVSCSP